MYSTTICKSVDIFSALHQSDFWILNEAGAETVHSSSMVRNLHTSFDDAGHVTLRKRMSSKQKLGRKDKIR